MELELPLFSDSHINEASRFPETIRLHHWILDDVAQKAAPPVILHGGDVFHAESTIAERNAAHDIFQRAAEIAPVVLVRGNHDAHLDLEAIGKLRAKHPIHVFEEPGVVIVNGVAIACLPWPRKAELLARLADANPNASVEEAAALAQEALRAVLRGLGRQLLAHDGPRVLLAHAMVRGSVTSAGQPLVGCDMELGLEDLALACADVIALGHVHKSQEWEYDGVPIVYPGAPRRTAYGELEAKGYMRLVMGAPRFVEGARVISRRIDFVETPTAPMLLLTGEWMPEEAAFRTSEELAHDAVVGAEIRYRYSFAADRRAEARKAAEAIKAALLASGAAEVTLEPKVIADVRARAPEIAAASTLEDRVTAYRKAREIAVSKEREARLSAKLAALVAKREAMAA